MSTKRYYLGACACGLLAGVINDYVIHQPTWFGALLACVLAGSWGVVVRRVEERQKTPRTAR